MAKVEHDFTCEEEGCGKPATRTFEELVKVYNIDSEGNFDRGEIDDNYTISVHPYCDDHCF